MYKTLKTLIMRRTLPCLRWLCLKQGNWVHPAKIPRAAYCPLSSSVCTCRLSYGTNHSMQSTPMLSIFSRDSALLAWSLWSLGSIHPVGLDLLDADFFLSVFWFCRTGLKRSPSASSFQTWISCEQLLLPSAHCCGNSWKMFTQVVLAALSRKENGWRS